MSTDSIGSAARDFANLADWFAAIPATVLENEIGEVYKDSEFTLTAVMTFTGKTVGAFSITLRPAAGQGFADSLSTLNYSATQGAAFTSSTGYLTPMIAFNQAGMTIQGLQFRNTAATSGPFSMAVAGGAATFVKNCIIDGNGNTAARRSLLINDGTAINCLVIHRNATASEGVQVQYGGAAINITCVRPSGLSAAGTGFVEAGGTTNIVKNCCAFNFTTDFTSSGWDAASDYNASDGTNAPGANAVDSLTYADQFENTTNDWRLKAGSGMIDTGNTDGTNAPADIIGTTRGSTTDGDIGCWEYVAAGGGTMLRHRGMDSMPFHTLLDGGISG